MKTEITKRMLVAFLAVFMVSTGLLAQDKSSRPSPPATAKGMIGDATVTVDYSSPAVKGRKIWGDLIPYGKAWRAGANEATILETDKDLKIKGKTLPAGKYSLFATPGEKKWEIILNSETGQWGVKRGGEANRDPAKDVLKVMVKAKKADMHERLTYEVNKKGIALMWDKVSVQIPAK